MKILLVDDEKIACNSIRRMLKAEGIRDVAIALSGREALEVLKKESFDVVLLDVMMPGMNGDAVLEEAKKIDLEAEYIMLTALDDIQTAVRCLKLGAYDYLTKPADHDTIMRTFNHAYEHKLLLKGLAGFTYDTDDPLPPPFQKIKTSDKNLLKTLRFAAILAVTETGIMITGETGTGKELVARAIHEISNRRNGPFVAVNVSAIAENLFESAFFGHVRGAFTGADKEANGYIEAAERGTLFLDEIGDLSGAHQAKILRVLQEQDYFKVGSSVSRRANIRFISATNKDLKALCKQNRFRTDLYYRLRTGHIHLPPLRTRGGDVLLLAHHFLNESNKKYGKKTTFTPGALAALQQAELQGNVRELAQIIERAVLAKEQKKGITPGDLDLELFRESNKESSYSAAPMITLKECRMRHILGVLKNCGGNRTHAAEALGISVRQLQKYLAKLQDHPSRG
jgi:DNA-binding NtrC family response regulator